MLAAKRNPSPQSSKKYQRKGRTPSRLTINTFRSIQHLTAMKIQYAVNTIIRRVLTQQEIDRCQLAGGIIVSNCGHTCICICFSFRNLRDCVQILITICRRCPGEVDNSGSRQSVAQVHVDQSVMRSPHAIARVLLVVSSETPWTLLPDYSPGE